jgi:hypothetical protein
MCVSVGSDSKKGRVKILLGSNTAYFLFSLN